MWIRSPRRKEATSVPGLVFAGRQLQPMVTTCAAARVPSNHSSVTLNNILWCAQSLCLAWEQPRSGRQREGAGKETGNKNYYSWFYCYIYISCCYYYIFLIYWEILGVKRSYKNISFPISSAVQELPGRVKSHCRWVIILIDTVNGTIKLEKIMWQLR